MNRISFTLTKDGCRMIRVSFNGDLLEVSAVLTDAEEVDRLVKALQANKALLPEKKKDEAANRPHQTESVMRVAGKPPCVSPVSSRLRNDVA
jgi:hypothetical protein